MTEPTKLQRLAEYYDTHETSTELESRSSSNAVPGPTRD